MKKAKAVYSYRLSEKTIEKIKYLANGLECSDAQIIEFSIRQVFQDLENYCTANNKKLEDITFLPILEGIKNL